MTRLAITLFTSFVLFRGTALSQPSDPINLEEEKVAAYTLPDVLQLRSGERVRSVAEWERIRRPQIVALYQQYVYGKMPLRPKGMHVRVNSVNESAVNNKAVCKQVTIFFTPGTDDPSMDVLLYLPKAAKGRVPVFTGLNFYGNQSTTTDTLVRITERWVMSSQEAGIKDHRAGEQSRGLQATRWPVEMLIDAGYGLATAYYGDLEPDHEEGWKEGVRGTAKFFPGIKPSEWSAIGAWAWGLSRMLDYLETEAQVDAGKVIVTGHSRLGKAALWAAANDRRFAAVVSNNSGEGAAALFRRNFGETITRINQSFPHWFVPAFKAFNGRPAALPVDQHFFLSLMAPRPLYVTSATDDTWADPKGEFLSTLYTKQVYQIYKKKGLGQETMPPADQPVGEWVRYHLRTGKHDITPYDWEQFIRFADSNVR
jgi:hypothetical protein